MAAAAGAIVIGPLSWRGPARAAAFQSGAAKAGAVRACSLFTQAEIRKIYGAKWRPAWDQVQIPPDETELPGGGSECSTLGLSVQLDAVPVARFEANRQVFAKRSTFERVTGVGDEAWFYEQGAPGTMSHIVGIYARAGQHVYVLSIDVFEKETAASLRPLAIAFGQAAAAKLR
jgi:hypothetical protein